MRILFVMDQRADRGWAIGPIGGLGTRYGSFQLVKRRDIRNCWQRRNVEMADSDYGRSMAS
jgi:hypothetical protein